MAPFGRGSLAWLPLRQHPPFRKCCRLEADPITPGLSQAREALTGELIVAMCQYYNCN